MGPAPVIPSHGQEPCNPAYAVGLLTSLKTFELQRLRHRQKFRIESLYPDRLADGGHGPLHGVQEGGTCIVKQMPTTGNLNRFRQGTCDGAAIAAIAVPGDDLNTGMRTEPRFHGGTCGRAANR